MKEEILAWRKYPEPTGTNYYAQDLNDPLVVEQVFDYCQILEATIFEKGWQFLMEKYQVSGLFEINQKSGWFAAEDLEEFAQELEAYWVQLQFDGLLKK